MQKPLLLKLLAIGILSVLLLVPLLLIESKISERSYYRHQVKRDIASSWTGSQKLTGPILVLPYELTKEYQVWDKNLEQYVTKKKVILRRKFVFPERIDISGDLNIDMRSRGIYSIPVYTAKIIEKGVFHPAATLAQYNNAKNIKWLKPYISIAISDMRGITSNINMTIAGAGLAPQPGSGIEELVSGLRLELESMAKANVPSISFELDMEIRGTDRLEFVPIASSTNIAIKSTWPHPKFIGQFLPQTRTVDSEGFHANWSTSNLATNIQELFEACMDSAEHCHAFKKMSFGVELIQSVDIYHKTERAVKYGFLFVVLMFSVFFLFEILKSLRIHPVQYLLVGFTLAMFYQILLSLTEHIAFSYSYGIAAVVSIVIISVYMAYVLQGVGRVVLLSATMGMVYTMLYIILLSEDYALLMGTSLIVIMLVAFMVSTRKVNWYRVGDWIEKQKAEQ